MRSAAGNPCKPGDLPVAPLALLVAKRANDPVIRRDDPDRFRLNCGKCTGNILLSQKVDPRLIGGDVRANLLNLIERSLARLPLLAPKAGKPARLNLHNAARRASIPGRRLPRGVCMATN